MSNYRPAGLSDEEDDDDDDFEFSTDYDGNNYRNRIYIQNKIETDENRFYTALKDGNIEAMNEILSKGFHVNQPLSGGWSALMHACSFSSLPVVEFLIKSGANVNFNNELFTSLMALCKSTTFKEDELVKCLNVLLKHGANINATDKNSCTALMYACAAGHEQVVKILVDCKCEVNIQDSEGWSALFHAVSEGREEIIRILIEGKARVDLIDRRRRSALDLAVAKGYDHLGKLVCSKRERRRVLEENENSTIEELEKWKDPVQELLSQLPAINAKNMSGFPSDINKLLWGMGLGHFCKQFVSQKVQLNELLLITSERLEELGVRFSVHRNRILDSIRKFHLHQWNKSSLGLKPRNQQLNVEDGVRLVYNVTKHLHIISATMTYTDVHQPLPMRPEVFTMCDSALHQLTLINNELYAIQQFAASLKRKENIEPVDLIKPRIEKQSHYFVPIVVTTIFVGFVVWKRKYDCHMFFFR